jgi:hypothetical protein
MRPNEILKRLRSVDDSVCGLNDNAGKTRNGEDGNISHGHPSTKMSNHPNRVENLKEPVSRGIEAAGDPGRQISLGFIEY